MITARRPFVPDASATFALLFDEPNAHRVRDVLRHHRPVVPAIWPMEVSHVILTRERRRAIPRVEADRLLRLADALAAEVVADDPRLSVLDRAAFARPHQLTTYDATYLRLAVDRSLPLLSFDRNQIDAASRLGVPLL